jgi:hypothetical protein
MMNVNFMIIVTIVSEGKKKEALPLSRPSHVCSTVSVVSLVSLHNPYFYMCVTSISVRCELRHRVSWTVNIYARIPLHSLNVIKM